MGVFCSAHYADCIPVCDIVTIASEKRMPNGCMKVQPCGKAEVYFGAKQVLNSVCNLFIMCVFNALFENHWYFLIAKCIVIVSRINHQRTRFEHMPFN